MFTLIREAEARLKLGAKAKELDNVRQILGVSSLTEMMSPSDFEITPADYQEWLKAIIEIAQERGLNVSKKIDFMDLAHDLLDDDPKLDALGGDRMMAKRNIVNALWQAYRVNQAHNAVQDHVANTIKQAQQDEEAADGLVGSEDAGGGFTQAFNAAKGAEDEEQPRNPYRPGTLRHALWAEKHMKGMQDEEFDDVDGEGMPQDDMPPEDVDTDSMDPDQLASHIMGREGGETSDEMGDEGGEDDLISRVDDLEARVADLESGEAGEDMPEEPPMDGEGDLDMEEEPPMDAEGDLDGEMGADDVLTPDPEVDSDELAAEKHLEDEQVSDPVRMAITSPKEHMHAALKAVEDEGAVAFMRMEMPKNPHPPKSAAHHAWQKGFKASLKDALGIVDKPKVTSKPRKRR